MNKASKQTDLARKLRRQQTDAERTLWAQLSSRRMQGVKFRRQQPIGPYIVDFVSLERRLVIEVDGGHHGEEVTMIRDRERAIWLKERGYEVIRFWNNDVQGNLEGVLDKISEALTWG